MSMAMNGQRKQQIIGKTVLRAKWALNWFLTMLLAGFIFRHVHWPSLTTEIIGFVFVFLAFAGFLISTVLAICADERPDEC